MCNSPPFKSCSLVNEKITSGCVLTYLKPAMLKLWVSRCFTIKLTHTHTHTCRQTNTGAANAHFLNATFNCLLVSVRIRGRQEWQCARYMLIILVLVAPAQVQEAVTELPLFGQHRIPGNSFMQPPRLVSDSSTRAAGLAPAAFLGTPQPLLIQCN